MGLGAYPELLIMTATEDGRTSDLPKNLEERAVSKITKVVSEHLVGRVHEVSADGVQKNFVRAMAAS